MPQQPSILLAIPCYNCEKQIPRVIEKLTPDIVARLAKVIIIDNQSRDTTIAAAKEAIAKHPNGAKFQVLRNNENVNLGGSHKVAFEMALAENIEYVAIVHGDDQATPSELNGLIDDAIQNPESAAILGARFLRASTLHGYSPLRIWGNRVLNTVFTIFAMRFTVDLGSGLNLFRMKDLADRRYLGFLDTLTFNVDILLDYYRKGATLVWHPITWSETDQVSNARIFHIAWAIFKQLLLWRFGISEKRIQHGMKQPRSYTSTPQ